MINLMLEEGASQGPNWVLLIVLGVGIIFMVISMIRSSKEQKVRAAQYEEMKERLKVGDEVQTIGGIVGTIAQINKKGDRKTVVIESSGTKMEFLIDAIGGVVEDPSQKTESSEETEESHAEVVAKEVQEETSDETKEESKEQPKKSNKKSNKK